MEQSFQEVQNLCEKALQDGVFPGCVVSVGRNGSELFKQAFGLQTLIKDKDKEAELPRMKVSTVFDIASMTKFYTHIIAYNLIRDGYFKREDKISMLLSRELEAGEKIQLELKTIDGRAKKQLTSGSVKYIKIDGKSVIIPVDDLVSNSKDCFVFGQSNRAITIIARVINESGTLYEQTYEFNTFDI